MGTYDIMVLSEVEPEHTGHVISRLFEPVYLACVAQTALEIWDPLSHLLIDVPLFLALHISTLTTKLPKPRPITSK